MNAEEENNIGDILEALRNAAEKEERQDHELVELINSLKGAPPISVSELLAALSVQHKRGLRGVNINPPAAISTMYVHPPTVSAGMPDLDKACRHLVTCSTLLFDLIRHFDKRFEMTKDERDTDKEAFHISERILGELESAAKILEARRGR